MGSTQNKEPRLWVERLIIFKSLEPLCKIREILLSRGLNIIWGVSPQLPDDAEGNLTGHSVGKTAFCRLLRYCLGENTFNRKSTQARIIECLPESFVGAELHLDGQRWAVLRPLGCKFDSHACQGTINDVIAMKNTSDNFNSFVETLRKMFLEQLPVDTLPQSDKPFRWEHLLAWISRDQETRYQSLCQWRSARSEATPLGFARQQKDPAFLIKMLLGLLDKEEVKLNKEIDSLQKVLAPLYQTKMKLEQEPINIINYQEKILTRLLKTPRQTDSNLPLWDVGAQAHNEILDIDKKISQEESKVQTIDSKITAIKYWIQRWQERHEKIEVIADVTKEGTETQQYEDEDIKNLKDYFSKICTFGNIEFNKCEHYLHNLPPEKGAIDIHENRAEIVTQKRNSALKSFSANLQQIQETVNNLKTTLSKAEKGKRDLNNKIDNLKNRKKEISIARDSWKNAIEMKEGTIPNTELNCIVTRIDSNECLLKEAKHNFEGVCSHYSDRAEKISALYDKILKSVLSKSYAGKFWIEPEDIHFEIDEGSGEMSGEAVETLSLILADVTAMVWNFENGQQHPGFLVHDSPREADLDVHVYNRFLKGVFDLMEEYGRGNAPFQYIITTTSEPPGVLKEAKVLRAELKAIPESELLFRQRFNSNQATLL